MQALEMAREMVLNCGRVGVKFDANRLRAFLLLEACDERL